MSGEGVQLGPTEFKSLTMYDACYNFFAMQLSKIKQFFFLHYFGNVIATNQLQQFFFPPISAISLPQTNCNNFFFLLFRQCHCHKSMTTFFFLRNDMCTPFLQQILNGSLLLVVIVGLKK